MELKITDLTKHYGKKCALDHFSYHFEPGVYGILGANGAGKSTLMSLIADTLVRESGEILYNGQDILKLKKQFRRVLGYMPQEQGFYDKMTVQGFLLYIADLKAIPRKIAKQQVSELLRVVNLEASAHKKLDELSGGMRQRALLVQALLGSPEVIILDEPTAGLDPAERRRLCRYIYDLGENSIVFLTSHIVSDIESTADWVLIMSRGSLVADGTPEEIVMEYEGDSLEDVFLSLCNEEREDRDN